MEMRSSEAGRYDAILHLPRKNIEIGGGYDAYGSLVKNNVEEMHVVYNDADVAIFFLVPNSSCHPSQIMLLAAGIDFL
jgi:hypothetical protein